MTLIQSKITCSHANHMISRPTKKEQELSKKAQKLKAQLKHYKPHRLLNQQEKNLKNMCFRLYRDKKLCIFFGNK